MQNIFGIPPKEDEVTKQLKGLETQKKNLEERLRAEGIDPDTLGGDFDNRNLIEKALNLKPDQGVLMDFFEVLNRPVQAVKGALTAGQNEQSILEGAWEGLSGQKETSGREVFGLGQNEEIGGVAGFVMDVGIDIALDPLTYVPAGYFLKSFKKLTTRTEMRMFQLAQMKAEKVVGEVLAELGQDGLETAFRNLSDSRVYKLGQAESDVSQTYLKYLRGQGETAFNKDTFFAYMERLKLDANTRLQGLVDAGADAAKIKAAEKKVRKIGKDIQAMEQYLELGKGYVPARFLTDYARVTDYVDDASRVAQKEITYLNDIRLENMRASLASGTLNNTQVAELGAVESLLSTLQQTDDVKFVATSSTNKLDDVIILRRYKDTDYFINVGKIEAKGLGIGGINQAMFKRIALTVKQTTPNGPKFLDFSEGSEIAGKLDDEFKSRFFKTLERIQVTQADGTIESLAAYMSRYIDDSSRAVFRRGGEGFKISGKLKGPNELLYKNLMFELGQKSGFDLMYAADSTGKGMFFRFSDVFDEVTFLESMMVRSNTTNVEDFFGKMTFDLDAIAAKGKYVLTEDIGKKFIEDSMQVNVTILDDLSKKGGIIGASAKGLQKVGQTIGTFFNASFNFSDFAKDNYKFILGESNLFVQRQSARLSALRQEVLQRYPDAGELITELFEAGAYLDDTGNIVTMNREMHIEDFIGYVLKRVNDGTDIPMPKLIGSNTSRDILDMLETVASDVGLRDNLFEIVEQGNATGLRFTGTIDDIKAMSKHLKTYKLNQPMIRFGKAPLSFKAEQFLRAEPQAFKDMGSLMNDILATLVKEGGFNNIIPELSGQIGYMRHLMTKGAYEAMQITNPGVLSKYAKPGMDVLAGRTFLGSVDEVNAALKEFYKMDMDFFNKNAFDAMEDLIKITSRKVEQKKVLSLVLNAKDKYGEQLFKVVDNLATARRALAPHEVMIKSFDDEFAALVKNLSPDSQKEITKILAEQGFGTNKAIVMNRNAHGLLKRAEKAYTELPELIKAYDKFLNTWKGLTLITPGFHMRNLFGNMFNSYAVGMDLAAQSKYSLQAMQDLNQYNELIQKVARGIDLTASEKAIYDKVQLFNQMGLVQSHRGVRDLEQVKEATELAIKEGGNTFKNTYNNAIRFNFNIAEKMDDVQRYMLWSWSFDKTGDATAAARTVTESLFDYQHLTNFEKDVMKRVFPFYTFMKNNFIFQAKNIVRNPARYARTGRAYRYYLEDIAGYSPEDMPDYATENMWLPIPMSVNKNDKKAIAFLKANLPLADFTELVENPFKKGVVSLSAPLKLPIELGVGRDLFTGAPITAFPGERNRLAEKTGVLGFLRDERGNLVVSQMPLVQKIMNDIGLRTPLNFGSVGLDVIDTLAGYQGAPEGLADLGQRLGLVGVQEMEKLELTALYQDLERLRELKKYYEQETGNQLPLLPRA